jgi:hypothetical protein
VATTLISQSGPPSALPCFIPAPRPRPYLPPYVRLRLEYHKCFPMARLPYLFITPATIPAPACSRYTVVLPCRRLIILHCMTLPCLQTTCALFLLFSFLYTHTPSNSYLSSLPRARYYTLHYATATLVVTVDNYLA